MSLLTDQEVQVIEQSRMSYDMLGISANMQRNINMPAFQSSDDANALIEGLSLSKILGEGKTATDGITLDFSNNKITVGYGEQLITLDGATGHVLIGGTNVLIDGPNKRLIVNDGTNDRVLIGYQSGGF